jgi:hypothetical protein
MATAGVKTSVFAGEVGVSSNRGTLGVLGRIILEKESAGRGSRPGTSNFTGEVGISSNKGTLGVVGRIIPVVDGISAEAAETASNNPDLDILDCITFDAGRSSSNKGTLGVVGRIICIGSLGIAVVGYATLVLITGEIGIDGIGEMDTGD